jgi:lysine-specific histone demethylase 1
VNDQVHVTDATGSTERAAHVVVTAPLSLLQDEAIAFDPPLDGTRLRALGSLRMCRIEKVALVLDEATDLGGFRGSVTVGPADLALPTAAMNLGPLTGVPAIVALAAADDAPVFADAAGPTPGAVDGVIDMLEAITGRRLEPVESMVTRWTADPYSRGGYAYRLPGYREGDQDLLAEPHAGRVLFAGEATTAARTGYADGAFSTGIREAKRLLGAASVTVGPLLD